MRSAPRIETERLILRGFERRDLDVHAETLADPEVIKHLGIEPLTREESWRRLLVAAGFWPIMGFGTWAVELKSDGRTIGHVGFFEFEREMIPSIRGEPEMGWIFHRSAHGHGYASEAGFAALEWADRELRAPSYPAIIAPANEPSMSLAGRLGFKRVPDGIYKGEPVALFRRPGKL